MNSLIIGRFQPLHQGHKALIRSVLDEGKRVVVAIRDTPLSDDNPYPVWQRWEMISTAFQKEMIDGRLSIMTVPDVAEVVHGRRVGWDIREVELPEVVEEISATAIRQQRLPIVWLTGNSGAGKTTLAHALRRHFPQLINLDGNQMRSSISLGATFTKEDRWEHNARVARLAQVLQGQGPFITVSLIAPYRDLRQYISSILEPNLRWVYVHRTQPERDDYPYEPPLDADFVVDSDTCSPETNAAALADWLLEKGE